MKAKTFYLAGKINFTYTNIYQLHVIYKVDYFDPNMYDIHGKGANCLIFSSKTLLDPINGTALAGVKHLHEI